MANRRRRAGLNGLGSGSLGHLNYFCPLRMCVDDYEEGPAKSMCKRCHGCLGQTHGCNGAFAGACFTARQARHDLAMASKSLSSPNHHT